MEIVCLRDTLYFSYNRSDSIMFSYVEGVEQFSILLKSLNKRPWPMLSRLKIPKMLKKNKNCHPIYHVKTCFKIHVLGVGEYCRNCSCHVLMIFILFFILLVLLTLLSIFLSAFY